MTFEVEIDSSGMARVKLAGVTLFTHMLSTPMVDGKPNRSFAAQHEAMQEFAKKLKDAIQLT